jgi:hypothetical protein
LLLAPSPLRGLWNKWLKTTILEEFSRIDAIKGQASKGRVMTAVAPRAGGDRCRIAGLPDWPMGHLGRVLPLHACV